MGDSIDGKIRCFGNGLGKELSAKYHDEEWGIPEHNDSKLFGKLILDGAQAGLSWDTILKKRKGYETLFHNFNIVRLSEITDSELEQILLDSRIVRNRLKVYSVRKNAKTCLDIINEVGSFNEYIWSFVNGKPIINAWKKGEVPTSTEHSDALSKDLKKRGMSFVGTTIIYAYMQAVGMVYDHTVDCWCYQRDHPQAKNILTK